MEWKDPEGQRARGRRAEDLWLRLRGLDLSDKSGAWSDIHEHWDVQDPKYGKVDIKAPKSLSRISGVDFTIWWELKTVRGTKGWGVPNGLDRTIAILMQEEFVLIRPADIIDELRDKCRERGYGKGEFMLYSRPGREDLVTILPEQWARERSYQTVFVGEYSV